MNATEIRAVLDAHDALVRDCAESRLTFGEFLGLWAGLHGAAKLGSVEDSGTGDFLPSVALKRLRELVARYPEFEATVAQSSARR